MQELTSTRNELMARYMAYLTGQTNLKNEPNSLNYSSNRLSNHPNPFINKTKIEFSITDRAQWLKEAKQNYSIIQIYDIKGSLVTSHRLPITSKYFIWDGRSSLGKEVKSGTYLVQFKIGKSILTKTIIKAK